MPLESRTRITLLLPAPKTYPQYLLVDKVLSDLVQICGGVTLSSDIPAVFRGRWYDAHMFATVTDELLLIFADVPVPSDSTNLTYYLDRLKLRAQREFTEDIIWITIHDVRRIATDDYQK